MRRAIQYFFFASLLLCVFALNSRSQCVVTASVTITNLSTNGVFFTVNGDTRIFTNNVSIGFPWVLTNSDVTGSGSKTNLFQEIGLNPFFLVTEADTGSNTFQLISAVSTNCVNPLVLNMSTSLGSFSYSTQTVQQAVDVRIPTTIESQAEQTNIDSGLVAAINNAANTNQFNQNATAMAQEVGTSNTQTIVGPKTFYGPIVFTNAANYSNAFSSPGSAAQSEQFGATASASASDATAVGWGSQASQATATALGYTANASGQGASAIGAAAQASGLDSTAIGAASSAAGLEAMAIGFLSTATAALDFAVGYHAQSTGTNTAAMGISAQATGTNCLAVGNLAIASQSNSAAIGNGAQSTAPNQMMIGAPGIGVVIQNNLVIQTNGTIGGTLGVFGATTVSNNATVQSNLTVNGGIAAASGANFTGGLETNIQPYGFVNFANNSDIAFSRYAVSSLANGANADVPVGTNVFIEVSGPTGAFTLNGFANGRDGKWIVVLNQTGQNMSIANESGTDATAANRIRTLTGIDMILFGNSSARFIYNGNVSRWIFLGGSAAMHANTRTMNAGTQLTQAAGIFQNNCPVPLECQIVMRWASGAYQVNVHGNSLGGTTQTVSNMPIYELLQPGDTVQLNGATTLTSDIYTNAW